MSPTFRFGERVTTLRAEGIDISPVDGPHYLVMRSAENGLDTAVHWRDTFLRAGKP